MKALKTLKDLEFYLSHPPYHKVVRIDKLKVESIKWVKEDLKWIGSSGAEKGLILRWMERLNITEADLK